MTEYIAAYNAATAAWVAREAAYNAAWVARESAWTAFMDAAKAAGDDAYLATAAAARRHYAEELKHKGATQND